jgi:Tfp pilus assembly protein PilN
MIRINLLPADLRRGTRLPAKVLAAAFGSAVAVSAAIGWFGLVWFGDLGNAEDRLTAAEAKLAERQTKISYVDELEANQQDYSARVKTIQDIGKSRRVWSKFLDELIDVVNNNGDIERHLAWFDKVDVKGDPKQGSTVSMQCNVQGEEQDRLANFDDDLAASPFGKEVARSDPQWQKIEDKTRVPAWAFRFPLSLKFAPTVKDTPKLKPAAAAATAAPAK